MINMRGRMTMMVMLMLANLRDKKWRNNLISVDG